MKAELFEYETFLIKDEKSINTISKYLRDVSMFLDFVGNKKIDKNTVLEFKKSLLTNYAVSSVNSILSSLNSYLGFLGLNECKVKYEKVQRRTFRDEGKELCKDDYYRMLSVAKYENKIQLYLIIETFASTGIRVSELNYLTVESLAKKHIEITLKGKTRIVILPDKLVESLFGYCIENAILSGPIFLTKNRKTIDRSSIWRQIKKLAIKAGVDSEKAYPHNFRHLFALIYYETTKDIIHLADILGHSNINTTRIYTQSSINTIKKELNHLDLAL